MQPNPLVEKQQREEAERRAAAAYRYPYRIVCVAENYENSDFPVTRAVRDFCANNHLTYAMRQYDVDRHKEDMYIHRLPAFHVYYKGYVQETHYYDTDPVYKIQLVVWAYQDELCAKERALIRRQQRWEAFQSSVQGFFSLDRFKRKPALDPSMSLSNTAGTPGAGQSTPDQTPRRGSAPG